MTKPDMRKQIADVRPDFQTLEKRSVDLLITIQGLKLFQEAKTVGAYMPLPDEVDITPLFQCLEKTFYIPAFNKTMGSYRLAQLSDELKLGKFEIPEPANPIFAPEKLDLILVPGTAFDLAGNRLGRGGGFYDRLLPHYRAVRVGICFDFQCLEAVPSEPHDVRMNVVVSD